MEPNEQDKSAESVDTGVYNAIKELVVKLEQLQAGPYRNRYYALAITHLQEAENWLARTQHPNA